MYFIVSSRFEMYSSEIYRHPLFKPTDIPSQVKAFVGFHTKLSSLETNLAFMGVLSMNFEINSVFHIRI